MLSFPTLNNYELPNALKLHIDDTDAADAAYGPIDEWDTSLVTDFSEMWALTSASNFTGNISSWDTSQGTLFVNAMKNAYKFNEDLSGWDVSRGVDFLVSVHIFFF